MNLIEKLGGYERASKIANCKSGVVHPTKSLLDALLEYRRANNIFEVGDKVVSKENNEFVYTVITVDGGLGRLKNILFDHVYPLHNFRHATDAEIAAGHRISHTDNLSHFDHCTDIRNHISPNTIVLDSDVINFDLYISMRSK